MKTTFKKKKKAAVVQYPLLQVSSPVFQNNGLMPLQYTCDGANINPGIDIAGIPAQAKSLAIIVEDPDAFGKTWVLWVAWNVPVTRHIKERCELQYQGVNDFKQHKYLGPCPPYGTHRYYFKIYALDTLLDLSPNTDNAALENAMTGHILAYGELIGKYKRR